MPKLIEWLIVKFGKSWLARVFAGKCGWKTVTAAAILAGVLLLQEVGKISPADADKVILLAQALGLVGLRDALASLKK